MVQKKRLVLMRYNIAVAADNNYFVPMYVMLVSLFTNNENSSYNLYVLHKEIKDENKQALTILASQYNCTIEWLNISDVQTGSFYTSHYITEAAYYRIYIPYLIPQSIDRVLYLDCDMLVMGNIAELYNTSFDDYALAAVAEAANYSEKWLNIPDGYPMFNSGVLLLNLPLWRRESYADKLIQNINTRKEKYLIYDQDALNEFFYNNVKLIHPKWNFQTAIYGPNKYVVKKKYGIDFDEINKEACIIHFTGHTKPWHFKCTHPYRKLYIQYTYSTPYKTFIQKPGIRLVVDKYISWVIHKVERIIAKLNY